VQQWVNMLKGVMNLCVGELQVMSEVLHYTGHSDPQLRGNAALVIGRFVRAVLGEGRGSWDNWMASLHPGSMFDYV